MVRHLVRGLVFLAISVVILSTGSWLVWQAITFNQTRTPFAPILVKQYDTYLPSFGANINGTLASVDPDVTISVALHYNGTLVAGQQTRLNLSAIARIHHPIQNITTISVGFQDALAWPNIPAQEFKQNGTAVLHPNKIEDNKFGGWAWIYFPLQGSYSPTIQIVHNECRTGSCVSTGYSPHVIDVASVQVQPTTRLDDEQTAKDNLQLTFAVYLIGIISLGSVLAIVSEKAWTNLSNN